MASENDGLFEHLALLESVSEVTATLDSMKMNLQERGWPVEYACQGAIAVMTPLLTAAAFRNGGAQ